MQNYVKQSCTPTKNNEKDIMQTLLLHKYVQHSTLLYYNDNL